MTYTIRDLLAHLTHLHKVWVRRGQAVRRGERLAHGTRAIAVIAGEWKAQGFIAWLVERVEILF